MNFLDPRRPLFLYLDWLPASGEEPRDFPLYCCRVTFFTAALAKQ